MAEGNLQLQMSQRRDQNPNKLISGNTSMEEHLLPMKATEGSSPTPSISPANCNHFISHRSHSAPSLFMPVGEASLGSRDGEDGALAAPSLEPSSFVKLASVGLVVYLACGVLIYSVRKGSFECRARTSTLVDGLYFSVVTLSTIGYGDIVPHTTFAKLFTCTFVLVGFGFVYALLNGLVAHVLDRQEQALLGIVDSNRPSTAMLQTYVMDVKKGRVRVRMKVGLAVAVVAGCVAVGAAMASLLEGLGWVDSFYLSVTSVTTVGYGDVGFETEGGRLFAAAWLLVSTLAVARAFLYLTELRMEKRNRKVARWVLERKMTSRDLVAADLDNDGSIRYVHLSQSSLGFVVSCLPCLFALLWRDVGP